MTQLQQELQVGPWFRTKNILVDLCMSSVYRFWKAAQNSLMLNKKWCRRRDSNPHGFLHTPLKRACLPVPPLRHRLNTTIILSLFSSRRNSSSGAFRLSVISLKKLHNSDNRNYRLTEFPLNAINNYTSGAARHNRESRED
jgi:hypothetical protein